MERRACEGGEGERAAYKGDESRDGSSGWWEMTHIVDWSDLRQADQCGSQSPRM